MAPPSPSSSSDFFHLKLLLLLLLNYFFMIIFLLNLFTIDYSTSPVLAAAADQAAGGGYNSIFCFGDSLSDTGNLLYSQGVNPSYIGRLPYGETYFHHPTGRFSNGRLIIDFIAKSLGLPLLPPYLGNSTIRDFQQGVNFAVGGATAVNSSFYIERNIFNPTNYSLGVQLDWFKQLLPYICDKSSSLNGNCHEFLSKSLFLVGEIGGNDYNHPFLQGRPLAEVQSFVPIVIQAISSAINNLIKEGAVTLVVPGNLPIGCSGAYLTYFRSSNQDDYTKTTGCLKWLNKFVRYHNQLLQEELHRLRERHPHTTIIYADYYHAAMQFYRSPEKLGFKRGALTACCGSGGGLYNYNKSATCGKVGSKVCEDPRLYVGWDGIHLTEAAYKVIATVLLQDHKYQSFSPTNLQLQDM